MTAIERNKTVIRSSIPHLPEGYIFTEDFGPYDKWSTFMRSICSHEFGTHPDQFNGKEWLELGIGDGRNEASLLSLGAQPSIIIGVDKVKEKIEMAERNLTTISHFPPDRLELHHRDAVSFLKKADKKHPFSGLGIMCLPQAPGIGTPADVYETDNSSPLAPWDQYGLYLNAETLSHLSEVVTDDFRLILILSGRVPRQMREKMMEKTGWHIKRRYLTRNPIKQDPDTSIDYVIPYDDGKRFYQKNEMGEFVRISAEVAAPQVDTLRKMIKDGVIDMDTAKKYLNVYHHLRVYILEKRKDYPVLQTIYLPVPIL